MVTNAAQLTAAWTDASDRTVLSRTELMASGCGRHELDARLAAGRWQRVGRAIVLHNAALSRHDRWHAARVNCGPRALLTALTALEFLGLTGWERDEIHVLAPAGVAHPRLPGLPVILHRTVLPMDALDAARVHRAAPAAVIAASSFSRPRSSIGLIAASVQQGLVVPDQLEDALRLAPRTRHRAELLRAVADLRMGADALSEIDFVQLCRRSGLPMPVQQAVRVDSSGRRRYLDAEWRRRDGHRVAVEVDGAVHLAARKWFDDQLRQNEISLTGPRCCGFRVSSCEPSRISSSPNCAAHSTLRDLDTHLRSWPDMRIKNRVCGRRCTQALAACSPTFDG